MPNEWEFKALNSTDYEALLTYEADNRLFRDIFNMAKQKLSKEKGIKAEGNPDFIARFDVPDYYFKYLKLVTRKQFKMVCDEVKEDKIIIINAEVTKSTFERLNNKWHIKVIYQGMYKKE